MASDPRAREEAIAAQQAALLHTQYVDARKQTELVPINDLISIADMAKSRVVPLEFTAHDLIFGFTQTTTKPALQGLQQKLNSFNVRFHLISESGFKDLLERYKAKYEPVPPPDHQKMAEELAQTVLEAKNQAADSEIFTKKLGTTDQKELFELITQQAYLIGASDIHVEPSPQQVRIRFRIDGVLHEVAKLPADRYQLLLNHLQMKSGIKWNADYPQTGHMNEQLIDARGQKTQVNMRVETIPATYGSDIVIRIFNLDVQYLNLNNLGLSQDHRDQIDKIIAHPHGMVLMVGPTGSGKTSTLYAILNQLNQKDVKIVTLEDPVEYELGGITQIMVSADKKETFGDKLKAVLREDPDIIMIGEIRDADTAKTALQAALTGHLVVSTFHANSASAAVTRMMDMIGQNPLLASAVKMIMAQRLLRRLCEHCKEEYVPTAEEKAKIVQILDSIKHKPNLESAKLFRSKGCKKCYHIGYKGRVGVAEQLIISTAMEKLIAEGTAETTSQKIEASAIAEGMVTILQDAVLKALAGITSLDEVFRVLES